MKLKFEISELALEDLDNIWEYTVEQWSNEQANKYSNHEPESGSFRSLSCAGNANPALPLGFEDGA